MVSPSASFQAITGDLVNVAIGKFAEQSSLSQWSRKDEAARAVSGEFPSDYAFHTDLEHNPWWQADLGRVYLIELISVHNRASPEFQGRARTVRIDVAERTGEWILIHAGRAAFGAGDADALRIKLGSQVGARYIRISLEEHQYLHLSQVEVFVRSEMIALADFCDTYGVARDFATQGSYRLERAPGATSDAIVGLKVNYSGRFGNILLQYVSAIQLAKRTRLRYVQVGTHELLDPQEPFSVGGVTFIPAATPLPSEGWFICGDFFDTSPFEPVLAPFLQFGPEEEAEVTDIHQDCIRPHMLTGIPLPKEEHPADELTVHIRSGDIFDSDHPVTFGYRQPPLSFYILVTSRMRDSGRINRVRLVFEDRGNPCIGAYEDWLRQLGIPYRAQSESLAQDLSALIDAPHLVFGHGTFGYAVSRLSKSIRTVHFFAPELGGAYACIPTIEEVYRVSDRSDGYIKAFEYGKPFGPDEGWRNTPEMRVKMLEYPVEDLNYECVTRMSDVPQTSRATSSAPPSDSNRDAPHELRRNVAEHVSQGCTNQLVNIALRRPAEQSSMSEWSKPNDPERAVSGRKTGGFAFCTSAELDPWWMVDLQSAFVIHRIVVFNREDDCADRATPMVIELSLAGDEWEEVQTVRYIFGGATTGTPLTFHLRKPIEARYLRLRRTGPARHFHLDQVEVYTGVDDIAKSSQLGQDLWVVQMTGGRTGGSFVDIGATDGVHINNTFLLEKRFGWRGVCVEPNPVFFEKLVQNRVAKVFRNAVFRSSGKELEFAPHGEIGTLIGFESSDLHASNRERFLVEQPVIRVETVSPNHLFEKAGLPELIDFLSLDTEGSEWDILDSINLNKYKFGLMTIEHNFVSERRNLTYAKLNELGYKRFDAAFDDWYYHPDHLDLLNDPLRLDFDHILQCSRTKLGYGKEPA